MVCIEFVGMSRTGKTTQKNLLVDLVRKKGLNIVGVERPRIPFRDFSSVMAFHNHYLSHLEQKIEGNLNKNVILLDRGFYDRKVMLDFDYTNGSLDQTEYGILTSRIERNLSKVDKGFLFMISPEESLDRFKKQKKMGLDFSYLNEGLIDGDDPKNLQEIYMKYFSLLKSPKLIFIDASKDISEIAREIRGKVFENGNR